MSTKLFNLIWPNLFVRLDIGYFHERFDFKTLLLVISLLIGLFLRLNNLGGSGFWSDELYHAWTARNILEGEGVYHPDNPGKIYLRSLITTTLPSAIFFWAFGYNEIAGRLPSVIIGILTMLVMYVLSRNIIDREYALISSFMFALSFWAITWHTQLRMYVHLQFLYVLGILIFYKWFKTGFKIDTYHPYLLILVSILGYHTHLSYIGIFAVFTFIVLLNLICQKFNENSKLNRSNVISHVRILAFFSMSALVFISVKGIPGWFYGHTPEWYTYNRSILFYFLWLSEYVNYNFIFVIGLILSLNYRNYWFISVPFLVPFIAQSLFFEYRMPRLIFHIYPFFIMTASLAIYLFYKWIKDVKYPGINKDVLMMGVIFFVLVLNSPISTYSVMSDNSHGMFTGHQDQRGPVDYISHNLTENEVLISDEPIKTDWYSKNLFEVDYGLHYQDHNLELKNYDSNTPIITDPRKLNEITSKNDAILLINEDIMYSNRSEFKNIIKENKQQIIQKEDWNQVIIVKFY